MLNLGIALGLMSSAGRLDTFLGLILPHGLLTLTAVLVAAGTGLRLDWTVIHRGLRTRRTALLEEGRAAIGLAALLSVSGAIEAFATHSGLPAWARIGIGVVAELLFLAYVFLVGRRAALTGETETWKQPTAATPNPAPHDRPMCIGGAGAANLGYTLREPLT